MRFIKQCYCYRKWQMGKQTHAFLFSLQRQGLPSDLSLVSEPIGACVENSKSSGFRNKKHKHIRVLHRRSPTNVTKTFASQEKTSSMHSIIHEALNLDKHCIHKKNKTAFSTKFHTSPCSPQFQPLMLPSATQIACAHRLVVAQGIRLLSNERRVRDIDIFSLHRCFASSFFA